MSRGIVRAGVAAYARRMDEPATIPTPSASDEVAAASTGGEVVRHPNAKKWAKEGVVLLGVASMKIVSRMIAWGAVGVVLGAIVWIALFTLGLLAIDWDPWNYLVWLLLGLYVFAGGAALGYAGFWRGIGRTILYVGVERGFVVFLTEEILVRVMGLVRKNDKVANVVGRSEAALADLPLQVWEEKLKSAAGAHVDDGEDRNFISRRIRSFICNRLEAYLLTIVRQEQSTAGGGGVSMKKVREIALANVEGFFGGFIEGMMSKKLMLMCLLLAIVFCVAPIVAAFL